MSLPNKPEIREIAEGLIRRFYFSIVVIPLPRPLPARYCAKQ